MNTSVAYAQNSTAVAVHGKDVGIALLRASMGSLLIAHGLMKVLVFTIPGTVGYFASIGFPPIAAYLTMFGELAGGMALLLGLYTRLAAPLTIPILLGAAYVHSANGWVFSNQGGGWEFPVMLAVLSLVLTFTGGGAFALRRFPVIDKVIPTMFKD